MVRCVKCGEVMMRLEQGVYWCKADDLIGMSLINMSMHWYERNKELDETIRDEFSLGEHYGSIRP